MTVKDIKKKLKFTGQDKNIINEVKVLIAKLPHDDSIDMGAMTSVEEFEGFGDHKYPDTQLTTENPGEIINDLQSIEKEIDTWWGNNIGKFSFDKESNQAKSNKNSKAAGAAAIITLVFSVLALVVGLVASFFVEDKDTLFFAIEGTKDIWNVVCDCVTILCPFCGIGSVISGAISFKQASGIKFRLTLSICSAIVIGITCVLIAFRAFGEKTWIAATVLFVVFLSIMVWCVVSLPKHEGEAHEEK